MEGLAQWTFSNPNNYTFTNASPGSTGASLAWIKGAAVDTSQADFSTALNKVNVDSASSPGDLVILNTSQQGPVQNLTFQPDPTQLSDNYLFRGSQNANFGTSPDVRVGNAGGSDWQRGVLQFPNLPLPSNATLRTAFLQLYMFNPQTAGPMDIGVYRMTSSWTEVGSTWNTRDGSTLWNSSGGGGDFAPAALDIVPGVTTALGWYQWNITPMARGWWNSTIPNQGLMVRQTDDTIVTAGRKDFYSSDATTSSLRPRLVITYTTPSSTGVLESRVMDAGSVSQWQTVWWNSTLFPGTSASIQTRSGNSPFPDASWGPWSSPYPFQGAPITSPWARYLQYRVWLFTPTATSPIFHDAAMVYGRYPTSGIVLTQPLLPSNLGGWGRLEVGWAGLSGTNIAAAYSQDNGSSWSPAISGQNLTSTLIGPLVLRLTLSTNNITQTPLLRSFSLGFLLTSGLGGGGGIGGPVWWVYLLVLAPLLPLLVYRRRRLPRVEEVFVVHRDGSLLAHRSRADTSDKDDEILMAMFTAIQEFIKESFSRGGTRELERMKLGDRSVEIRRGENLYLAVIYSGKFAPGLANAMGRLVDRLERTYGDQLRDWSGMMEPVAGIKDEVKVLFPRWRGPLQPKLPA